MNTHTQHTYIPTHTRHSAYMVQWESEASSHKLVHVLERLNIRYVFTYTCLSLCVCIYIYVYIYTHTQDSSCAGTAERKSEASSDGLVHVFGQHWYHTYMYVHIYIHMYLYACMYVCIYIHTHTHDTQLVKRNKIRRLPVLDWYIFLTTFLTTCRLCIHICAYVYIHTCVYKSICTHVLTTFSLHSAVKTRGFQSRTWTLFQTNADYFKQMLAVKWKKKNGN